MDTTGFIGVIWGYEGPWPGIPSATTLRALDND